MKTICRWNDNYYMNTEICGICRDELVNDIKTLDCAHAFHVGCIDAWTSRVNTCPFCRTIVSLHESIIYRARSGDLSLDDIYNEIEDGRVQYDELVLLYQEGYIPDLMYLVREELITTEMYSRLFVDRHLDDSFPQ